MAEDFRPPTPWRHVTVGETAEQIRHRHLKGVRALERIELSAETVAETLPPAEREECKRRLALEMKKLRTELLQIQNRALQAILDAAGPSEDDNE